MAVLNNYKYILLGCDTYLHLQGQRVNQSKRPAISRQQAQLSLWPFSKLYGVRTQKIVHFRITTNHHYENTMSSFLLVVHVEEE
jgi:hypothetical protein